jgi:hypothetical protein
LCSAEPLKLNQPCRQSEPGQSQQRDNHGASPTDARAT